MFSISQFKIFSNFPCDFFLDGWSYVKVFGRICYFQIFVDCQVSFLSWISSLIPLWLATINCMFSSFQTFKTCFIPYKNLFLDKYFMCTQKIYTLTSFSEVFHKCQFKLVDSTVIVFYVLLISFLFVF